MSSFTLPENSEIGRDSIDKQQQQLPSSRSLIFLYAGAFFIVIASVLGTGILALPVKLSKSGFTPFLLSYSIGLVMQILVLIFSVELLQRTKCAQEFSSQEDEEDTENDHSDTISLRAFSGYLTQQKHTFYNIDSGNQGAVSNSAEHSNGIVSMSNEDGHQQISNSIGPNLHSMGHLFLGRYTMYIFDTAVTIHFVSILISYTLAGSMAYGQLFGISHKYLIVPFILIFTALVIFGDGIIREIISVLTFGKGTVLILLVLITALVGGETREAYVNNWLYVGKPFLIGTVALGGAMNVLPVIFSKVPFVRTQMIYFLGAIISGLVVVWILNIIWCYYILLIVPQTSPNGGISLASAESAGEIATVPLIDIIKTNYPQYDWLTVVVDLFVMGSITVSYITLSAGFKYQLDGFRRSWNNSHIYRQWKWQSTQCSSRSRIFAISRSIFLVCCSLLEIQKTLLYSFAFGIVLIVAQTNPEGFLIVMEYVTSLALNLECGVLVAYMLGRGRVGRFRRLEVPWKNSAILFHLRYVVMLYFGWAIIYDIVTLFISGFT